MKRHIKCSIEYPKSYPFNGYMIYDTGYGFIVYDGNQAMSNEFVTSDEAEDFVLNELIESENLDHFYFRTNNYPFKFNLRLSNEIGLHCGTLEQASKFKGKYLYRIAIDTSNMFNLHTDITSGFYDLQFLEILKRYNIIDDSKYNDILMSFRSEPYILDKQKYFSTQYRKLLDELGYTGFIYPNLVEGQGMSVCVIDEFAIRHVKLIKSYR